MSLSLKELQQICSSKADGEDVYRALRYVPLVETEVRVHAVTAHILRVSVAVSFADSFIFNEAVHGRGEPFHVWLSEADSGLLLHQETVLLQRQHQRQQQQLVFAVPLHDPASQTQFVVDVVSDRWVGVSSSCPFSATQIFSSDISAAAAATPLLNIHPVPVSALAEPRFESLFSFSFFNPIQSQVFHVCYHTDYNVLLGAPTGSGKTIVAELAILRSIRNTPKHKIVYIAPLKALAAERLSDWRQRLGGRLGLRVAQLTADNDEEDIDPNKADLFICTPEKWDGLSRQWRTRAFVSAVGLLIIDEIHLLGQERGAYCLSVSF